MLQALIFDVDGTLADTEWAHLAAFNLAFAAHGLYWHWEEAQYRQLLAITGGTERLLHYWCSRKGAVSPAAPSVAEVEYMRRIHRTKTGIYTYLAASGHVRLRPGILDLLAAARDNGLRLAIATSTTTANIKALLGAHLGEGWQEYFTVIEDGATAPRKKPHPQVYAQCLAHLGLSADQCLAFEDSAAGLAAARAAGIPTVVTPSDFTTGQDFSGALRVVPDLTGVDLAQLRRWQSSAECLDPGQHSSQEENRGFLCVAL